MPTVSRVPAPIVNSGSGTRRYAVRFQALNLEVVAWEERREPVQSPGLPEWYADKEKLVSEDCVRFLP
jgi:hypothetical protein